MFFISYFITTTHLPLFDIVSEYDYYDTNIIIILFFERNVSDSINR